MIVGARGCAPWWSMLGWSWFEVVGDSAPWWSLLVAILVAGGSGWLWWWLLELVVVLHGGLCWAGGGGLRWLEIVLCGGLCWWFLSTRWRLSDSQNFPHLFSLSFTAMFSTIVKFLYLERINSFHFYKWLINIQKNLDRISKYEFRPNKQISGWIHEPCVINLSFNTYEGYNI